MADLLERAGGPAAGADLARLNLAQPLKDGQQVVVPRLGEPDVAAAPRPTARPANRPPAAAPVAGARINLNTASKAELESLPGIGVAIADRILRHREQHGPFVSVEAFVSARLVPAATWERIKELVDIS